MQQNRSQKNNKISHLGVGMDTKNETVWYGIGTNETIQYFNGTINGTLFHHYLMNFVVNIHIYDPWQSLIKDDFTAVGIL